MPFPAILEMNDAVRRPGIPHNQVNIVLKRIFRPTLIVFNLNDVIVSPWLFKNPKMEREPRPTARYCSIDIEKKVGASP